MKIIATIRAAAKLLWLWLRHPLAGIAVVRFMLTCGDRIAALQRENERIAADTARLRQETDRVVIEQYRAVLRARLGEADTDELVNAAHTALAKYPWGQQRTGQLIQRCAEVAVLRPNLTTRGVLTIATRDVIEEVINDA